MFHFSSHSPLSRHSQLSRKNGFTLIELLVCIAIISLLAAILFPVFGSAREGARRSSCTANLRQVGMGLTQYIDDYDGVLPQNETHANGNTQTIFEVIQPYLKSSQVYTCPTASEKARVRLWNDPSRPISTYAINLVYPDRQAEQLFEQGYSSSTLAGLEDASGTVFCGDSTPTPGSSASQLHQVPGDTFFPTQPVTLGSNVHPQGRFEFRHNNGANFVFMDGHVKWKNIWQAGELNKTGTAYKIFTRSLD